ncbi:MAG TPA: NAD-dependent epimerase/dehydratase family protein [Gaiellaceae bacterium]|nr:NAD-dependent epimerase/dehydratase family protein [Gaiellaceae bacterium]
MKLLLLGGPQFLGRALIEAALERGHEVTTFNRGRTNPDLFRDVEKFHGDRHGDLAPLRGRRWDAALDTSAYVPQIVRASAGLLRDAVAQYLFVSSISAYADYSRPIGEDAALQALAEGQPDDELLPDYANYGALKVLAERAVAEHFGERALIVRPGLIVGPHDPTDRFTYWARRAQRGGPVLAPGPPEAPVQLIDVRDLAAWMLALVERGESGVFNATSPPGAITFGSMLDACGIADPIWVDEPFLIEQGVEPWGDLPVWIPAGDEEMAYFLRADVSRALAAGLTFRPLAETARAVPEWTGQAGLEPGREAELLEAWKAAV